MSSTGPANLLQRIEELEAQFATTQLLSQQEQTLRQSLERELNKTKADLALESAQHQIDYRKQAELQAKPTTPQPTQEEIDARSGCLWGFSNAMF